jgi:hypothetical protein
MLQAGKRMSSTMEDFIKWNAFRGLPVHPLGAVSFMHGV